MAKNKTIVIIAGVFMLLCGCAIPLFSLVVTLPPENGLRQVALALFWGFGCIGLPLLGAAGLGWTIWDNRRSRQTAQRLATAMGLAALHDESNLMRRWYGGDYDGRSFAIKPVVFATRSYDGLRHRSGIGALFYLRIALAVNRARPLGAAHDAQGPATTLAEAFPRLENDGRLDSSARQALLDFVQKGGRNLRLLDRAAASPALLAADVLPQAAVILIHDLPKVTAVTPAALIDLLDDLSAIARTLE